MDADDILQLASQGEGQRLEFKRSLAELGTATRTVAAFANTDGGVLLSRPAKYDFQGDRCAARQGAWHPLRVESSASGLGGGTRRAD